MWSRIRASVRPFCLRSGVLASLCGLPGLAQAATPFPCDGQLYQIATANSTLKALRFTQSGNGYTTSFTDIDSAGANLNSGWGYSTLDDFIYGVRNNTRELWRIDFEGNFDLMATLDSTFYAGSFVGDMLDDGTMIYRARTPSRKWQIVGLTDPTNPVNLGEITISPNVGGADFAYNPVDGNIYGIDTATDRLYYVDIGSVLPGGGTLAPQFFGPAIYNGGYGAMWFDEGGRLYAYNNNTNEIFVINVGIDGNGTGNSTLLAVSTEDEGGINDGAYCRGPAPVPLGAVTGTLYVDSDHDDRLSMGEGSTVGAGVTVNIYYDNATPLDIRDDRFLGATETAADGTYFIDGLVTIETYRIEVDMQDPDLPSGATPGTSNPILDVTVTADTTTPDLDFGFDPGISDLEITKTANVMQAAPGDTVVWTISVTNNGTGSPSGVKVLDLIPSGFSYVSDDAPPIGDIYDAGLGIWFVDEILVDATETLNITTIARAGGNRTNHAEIVANSLVDPDSDVDRGRLGDDLNDGLPDDDEAQFTVVEIIGSVLSGVLILDNGADTDALPATIGIAHDGVRNGTELAAALASVLIVETTGGTTVATATVNPDGTWQAVLPEGFSSEVTIVATPSAGHLSVSEAAAGLPGLVNPSTTDGAVTFTPAVNGVYDGLDFGLVEIPRLSQDQSVAIMPGQVVDLYHRYEATTDASVTIALVDRVASPASAFSSALLHDTDCDGGGDTALNGPIAVVAGQDICVVVRTQVGSGVGDSAVLTYGLTAQTAFTGISPVNDLRNDDRLGARSGDLLVLEKRVRNVTADTPEGLSNTGSPNDVLEYRILLSNPGQESVVDVTINDATPAWTALAGVIASPVPIAPGTDCAVTTPNAIGYAGPIQWDCTGAFPPGAQSSVSFQVRIVP